MSRDETAGLRAAQLRLGRLPGYVRRPDPARRSGEKGHTYKKGWEVRFTARSEAEIAEIRDLVVAAGFAPARPFFKGHQLIQPVYGMAAVQAYLAARQAAEEHAARAALGRRRRAAGRAAGGHGAAGAHPAGAHTPGVHAAGAHAAGPHAGGAAHRCEREEAAAAATAAAAAATAVQAARRRAVEAFPTQVERDTAADRISPAEARTTS
ncbi:hypothetical protein [Streptomyces sp. 1331.2]|uniref:hypothetical protein n=1 Tax=Streptomyces sp. 1331.2 TaxID=1938835 RepID=UPI000BC5C00F|nr:hypothetical protein [Streptomyces sp. 1331.2]SOB83911.1 hypothetical protein SAMN06272789_4132 [Streptomyces sp. 1331.2]